jgi:hypothetical protein
MVNISGNKKLTAESCGKSLQQQHFICNSIFSATEIKTLKPTKY